LLKKIVLKQEIKSQITGVEKITLAFKQHKKEQPFGLFHISQYTGITSGGYLSNLVKTMIMNGVLEKVDCPQCLSIPTYRLVG